MNPGPVRYGMGMLNHSAAMFSGMHVGPCVCPRARARVVTVVSF